METGKRRGSGGESEGERDTERQIQTDRQAETDRHTEMVRKTENQRKREIHRHTCAYIHTEMLGIFKTWPIEASDGMYEIPGRANMSRVGKKALGTNSSPKAL